MRLGGVALAKVLNLRLTAVLRVITKTNLPSAAAEAGYLEVAIDSHKDAVEDHHRFSGVVYKGVAWDLAHLDAFALRIDPELGFAVDVVVLFSCHCFTNSLKRDGRALATIPPAELYSDGRETRVLSEIRYQQSKQFLPALIKELHKRKIQIAHDEQRNFVTLEEYGESGDLTFRYAVFFDVTKDAKRKKRLLLHVQSAYTLDTYTDRQKKAGKVRFVKLLRAAYKGEKV